MRRKTAFLLAALLVPHEVDGPTPHVATLTGTASHTRSRLNELGLDTLVKACDDDDVDVRESAARALAMYAEGSHGSWPDAVRPAVTQVVRNADDEHYGLDENHWKILASSVA